MTDIISLGIQIALSDIDKATKALDKLADASVGVEKATSGINKATKETAKTQEEAANKAALQAQREARAQRAVEQALLAKEKTVTQAAKTSAINAAAEIKAQNALQANIRAQTRLQEGVTRASAESAKRLDVLASKQSAQVALANKYATQAQTAQERVGAYTLNQQSLIENRALATQARITAGAQRQALMQEKFEFQKAQAAERAARRQADSLGILKGAYQSVRDIALGAFAVGGVAGGVGSIIKTADTMTLLDSRLKLATKSQEDFVKTQTALRDSSLKTGLNLESQIAGYTQLERSTRALGLSSTQLTFLTESFGKAAVVSGADTASYQSALTQLNQGFASGVIRGQEFNSVAEQAPAIMEALANGLRGSNKEFDSLEAKGLKGVAALRKMAGEGKLVNSVTIPALIEGLKVTNQQFDSMPLTVQRATEKLKTAYQIWIADQNNASGATKALAQSIESLSTNFGGLVSALTTGALVIGAALAGKLVAGLVSATTATKTWQVVTGEASRTSVAAAKAAVDSALAQEAEARAKLKNATNTKLATAAQAELSLATTNLIGKAAAYDKALASTALSQRALTTASTAFSGTLSLLGGPVGIAITGLTLLIAYWDDLKEAILGATSAHADFMKSQARISTANTGVDINKAIQDQVKHTKELVAQRDILNNKLKKTADYVNPRTGDVDQNRINRDRQQLSVLNEQIRESSLQEQTLEITRKQRNANVAEGVLASLEKPKIGGAPATTPSGKAPKAFTTGEQTTTQIQQENAALRTKLGILQDIDTIYTEFDVLKKQENEWDVKAKALLIDRNTKLDKGAKDYQQRYSELTKQITAYQDKASLTRNIAEWEIIRSSIDDTRASYKAFYNELNKTALVAPTQYLTGTPEQQTMRAAKTSNALGGIDTLRGMSDKGTLDTVAGEEAIRSLIKQQEDLSLAESDRIREAEANNIAFIEGVRDKYSQIIGIEQWANEQITLIKEGAAAKQKQISDNTRMAELENTAQVLGMAGSLSSQMTTMLKAAGQENSKVAKAMFIATKALAIADIIVNTQMGAMKAIGMAGPLGIPLATWIEGLGAASVATVAATSVMEYNQAFAKGAAFDGPVGAGSGVVSTPTTFPMSGGKTGLMGERGSEGILPLSRDANGRLGVTAQGVGGGTTVVQNVTNNITVQGGNTNEETAGAISRELLKTMERIADSRISNATRPTGILAR